MPNMYSPKGERDTSLLVKRPSEDHMLSNKLNRYAKDFNWIQDNMRSLTAKYLKKYIAVKDQKVAYVADSMTEMVANILADGNDVSDYIIEYLQEEKQNFVF